LFEGGGGGVVDGHGGSLVRARGIIPAGREVGRWEEARSRSQKEEGESSCF
jgi:hypothetical protein